MKYIYIIISSILSVSCHFDKELIDASDNNCEELTDTQRKIIFNTEEELAIKGLDFFNLPTYIQKPVDNRVRIYFFGGESIKIGGRYWFRLFEFGYNAKDSINVIGGKNDNTNRITFASNNLMKVDGIGTDSVWQITCLQRRKVEPLHGWDNFIATLNAKKLDNIYNYSIGDSNSLSCFTCPFCIQYIHPDTTITISFLNRILTDSAEYRRNIKAVDLVNLIEKEFHIKISGDNPYIGDSLFRVVVPYYSHTDSSIVD